MFLFRIPPSNRNWIPPSAVTTDLCPFPAHLDLTGLTVQDWIDRQPVNGLRRVLLGTPTHPRVWFVYDAHLDRYCFIDGEFYLEDLISPHEPMWAVVGRWLFRPYRFAGRGERYRTMRRDHGAVVAALHPE